MKQGTSRQNARWLAERRAAHRGGLLMWRTAMRMRGPLPRRWEDGFATAEVPA